MLKNIPQNKTLVGYLLALITIIVWSGNYVVARGISSQIPPISLAFFRWSTACIVITFFGYKSVRKEWTFIWQRRYFLLIAAITGVSIFNTFIYIAGHYTSAINLALIGTTVSPIFSTFFAGYFLKEHISFNRIIGVVICLVGILYLFCKGSFALLLNLQFGKGDLIMVISGISFAAYSTIAKKRPTTISPVSFLMATFYIGTFILLPFFVWEQSTIKPIVFTSNTLWIIAYIGIGNSVFAFYCWNAAIAKIGTVKTVLFSSLMPIFSSIEAVLFINEKLTIYHFVSASIVIVGLVLANIQFKKKTIVAQS